VVAACSNRCVRISTVGELLDLLDHLTPDRADGTSRSASDHWSEVLRREGHPLNTDLPDVNLLAWRDVGLLPSGRRRQALDVGCGLGRNARWLAGHGYEVTGIDIAAPALQEARSRTTVESVTFAECDFLRDPVPGSPFAVVYDSGFFHHVAPHRRVTYLEVLDRCLEPGGLFGVCTFAAGQMGATASDRELLTSGGLGEGIGYTTDDLRQIFRDFEFIAAGPQRPAPGGEDNAFRQGFLTTALFQKSASKAS